MRRDPRAAGVPDWDRSDVADSRGERCASDTGQRVQVTAQGKSNRRLGNSVCGLSSHGKVAK